MSSMDEIETLHELTTALEELRVVEEDLRLQNSALLAANDDVHRERAHYVDLFNSLPAAYVLTSPAGVIFLMAWLP